MASCARCGGALPEGARFCPACAAPVDAAPVTEERKLATVLFADLVGSTALGEQDPERTRVILDRFYDAMAAELTRAGGTVEKFAGDAVMAAFGAPAAQEDHAERALHAALAMRRRLDEIFDGGLQMRIGINTGDVVIGRPRQGSSFVTGDAVNVAKRLEQAADPGEILAGERTLGAAHGAFEFAEPREIEAKGKSGPVRCAQLVRALSLMRPRGVAGLASAFVGRQAELELLEATYGRVVAQGEPHLVTLMGDAGVGKTRLVRELWQWLASREPQPFQRTGRCLSYGQATYWALGEVLKEHLGILESDPPELAVSRLGGREILGLSLGLDVSNDLHPLAARDRLHEAWSDFVQELVAERPTVLLLEDLHWAEDPLLDLVERLVREVRGPVLLLGTARPELLDRRPAWGGGRRNASLLWLEPLSAEQSHALLRTALGFEFPELARIAQRAEGNPFFAEELLGSLIDSGVLAWDDGGWTFRDLPADFAVPDSVQALLAARIDLLPPREKTALQAASVIGRVFWAGPMSQLAEVDADLALLEDRDFVRRRPGSSMAGETEYAFKHALTREVAYAGIPKARRARLHAELAEWLERLGERDDLAPLLGHHYAEATRPEDADLAWAGDQERAQLLRRRAVTWLRRAAAQAMSRYDVDEALGDLNRALELESDSSGRGELWRAIGRAAAVKYDGVLFWTAMQRALEHVTRGPDAAEIYSELALETSNRAGMWVQAPDPALVDEWVERALELAEPRSAARVRALVARALWHPERGEADAQEASALATELGDSLLTYLALDAETDTAMARNDLERALTLGRRRYALADEITDPEQLAYRSWSVLRPVTALGRFDEAREMAAEYAAPMLRLTAHHRMHGVAIPIELESLTGDWETIRSRRDAVELAVDDNLATPCVRNVSIQLLVAAASAYGGDLRGADELEERAEGLGMTGYDFVVAGPAIHLALARGDLDRARRLVDRPFSPGDDSWNWFGLMTLSAQMEALIALGDRRRIEAEAQSLLEGGTYLEAFGHWALGVAREDEALVRDALGRFEAMGLDRHAAKARASL
jgi:class 3 adenylate cyclase